ncbi:DUF72 domain-containing protein [uncultured Caulobacter sp.]|uniref:DUF72 domain-containing protein n=1 Tax=uncultured Caulobacter sp. TaxID=158749 RepID=UPI0026312B86|nr:DUF72 domain-containing protein [uncultured Caulobacter sp.]
MNIRIGTAGWSLYRIADAFPAEGTGLQRYATRFNAVEINTAFYRPHRRQTYERWAASTPPDFRFAVKVPKAITHERRLVDIEEPLARLIDECAGLGEKLGPLLVQLPPSLGFDPAIVAPFLETWRRRVDGATVLEPRHADWFTAEADAMLAAFHVTRVAADPAKVPRAAEPAGWDGLVYYRLHGSPVMYRSAYEEPFLANLAERLSATSVEAWCVFDNTQLGAAGTDALRLMRELSVSALPPVP